MPSRPPQLLPDFLYGTAWKEDRTAGLTELALGVGFRGIDTANQRRHYFEEGVGLGLAAAYRTGLVTRDDLLSLRRHASFAIVTPEEFLRVLRAAE